MKKTYFTVTGTRHYFGQEFIEPGMEVKLVKEPDNEVDKEAIKVELEGLGQIGYVANSVTTRKGVSYSAGRLVDKIENNTCAIIEYVLSYGAICSLKGEVVNG